MPIYEYACRKCGHRFERIQKFSDAPVTKCPQFGAAVEMVLSAPAVQFKGSGWYVTDYARKGGGDKKKKSESGAAEKGEASKPAESASKPEKKD